MSITGSIELTDPREIDGDPDEVAATIRTETEAAVVGLVTYLSVAEPQLRNAYQTALLDGDEDLEAHELSQRWQDSDERAGVERVRNLAAALRGSLKDL